MAGIRRSGGYGRRVSPFPTRAGEGLPALGAVLLLGCAVYVAALVDVTLTGSLGWGLGVVLVVGSIAAAARLARRDLPFAVVTPPLAFAVGTAAAVPFTAASREVSFPLGTILAFAGALGGGAPLLGAAVVAAATVGGVRWELDRRSGRRAEPLEPDHDLSEPQPAEDPVEVDLRSCDEAEKTRSA